MVTIVREEISSDLRPLEILLLLFNLNCLHVFIHCAIDKFELTASSMVCIEFRHIFEEFIVYMSEQPREIHASCDHDVLCLKVTGIGLHTFDIGIRITVNSRILIEELVLDL